MDNITLPITNIDDESDSDSDEDYASQDDESDSDDDIFDDTVAEDLTFLQSNKIIWGSG